MKIQCIQHAGFEGPAGIADWAQHRDHTFLTTHLYQGEALPSLAEFDMLVLMGGPMSVNDEYQYPWLVAEKRLVHKAVVEGKFVLGVCLGAQLMANSLGARVYPAREKEIGWFPVRRVSDNGFGAALPDNFTVLHWHGETFDLPNGGIRLAETEAVPNQAFEVNRKAVEAFLENAQCDIGNGRWQQSAEAILECDRHISLMRPILFTVLDELAYS
jgi:GMP synthase-like glutamine amidotransferase